MNTARRMPTLTPEEIRKSSETAVADVAAQKIVASKSSSIYKPFNGNLMSKSTQTSGNNTAEKLAAGTILTHGASKVVRTIAASVLSQSDGSECF